VHQMPQVKRVSRCHSPPPFRCHSTPPPPALAAVIHHHPIHPPCCWQSNPFCCHFTPPPLLPSNHAPSAVNSPRPPPSLLLSIKHQPPHTHTDPSLGTEYAPCLTSSSRPSSSTCSCWSSAMASEARTYLQRSWRPARLNRQQHGLGGGGGGL
jgi:hypothetical protein